MKKINKLVSGVLVGALSTLCFMSCTEKDSGVGQVRYLNFKPEVASIYQELADAYEK